MVAEKSLVQRLGGSEVINEICEALYARVLLDDDLVDFFDGIDVRGLVRRQRKFMFWLLDDESRSMKPCDLRRVHRHLVRNQGLDDHHFDAMLNTLNDAMEDVDIDITLRLEVIQRMERMRGDVLGNHEDRDQKERKMLGRTLSFVYGVVCYAVGMAGLTWLGLWLVNLFVPNALDAEATLGTMEAMAIDVGLIALFALQHSGMARPAFKRAWTRLIPRHLERSTYVLISGLLTIGVCYHWQPIGGVVWDVRDGGPMFAIYGLYVMGWGLLVLSSFWINHFDLFGLRQVWLNLRNEPYTPLPFQTPGMYKYVRHPLYLGWFMIVWITPVMTVTHLMFAVLSTIYIVGATRLEERDLSNALPEYRRYTRHVPRFVPGIRSAGGAASSTSSSLPA